MLHTRTLRPREIKNLLKATELVNKVGAGPLITPHHNAANHLLSSTFGVSEGSVTS